MISGSHSFTSSLLAHVSSFASRAGKVDYRRYQPKRGAAYLLAYAALGCTVEAHADTIFQSVNTQLTASAGGQYTDYKETQQSRTLDSEKGFQGSYQGKASVQRDMLGIKDVYISASFGYAKGNTDYDGYLVSRSGLAIPYQSNTRTDTTDITVKLGKAFPLTPQVQVIYYAYYGYHQWIRDSNSSYGTDEHYRHHSLGVGMLGQYAITPQLVASIEGSVGGIIGASMNAGNTAGTFKLGSNATVTGALGLDYAVTRHVHVNAAYQVTHFKYGKSNLLASGYYEPESTTTNQTLLVGLGYAF